MKVVTRLEFFILSFLLLLIPKRAFAFMSPATVTLIAAAIGSASWTVLVIAGVNLILFFKKIKKRIKVIVGVISIISLIVIGAISFHRYNFLKHLNDVYDNVPLLKYEVDLNKITMKELSEYIMLHITTSAWRMMDTDNVMPLKQTNLASIFSNFPHFEKLYNLNKEKKYLVICENGDMSYRIATFLRERGYNTFCARLSRTHSGEFLNKYFKFKQKKPTTSLIIVPYRGEKNTVFIDFDFIHSHELLKESEPIDCDKFKKEMVEDKDIVCFSNFHCLMTKYFLDSHGMTAKKIYKFSIPLEEYSVGEAKKFIINEE